MDNIVWNDKYNIGIPEIDEQHKRIVTMINDLVNDLVPENIFDTVMKMSKYADDHFDLEEKLMFQCDCDQSHAHRNQHLYFRQKTSELAGLDYTTGKHTLDAFSYLCEWFINHIMTVDMEYRHCFQTAFESIAAEEAKKQNIADE